MISRLIQLWFIDKIQHWNNVDFVLTLKTFLLLHHDAWKIKIFTARLNDNCISTLKPRQFINIEILHWDNVDFGLTPQKFWSYVMMLKKLCFFILTFKRSVFQPPKQYCFIKVKSMSKYYVETTLIWGWI